jgi:hypothetical protein
LANEVAPGFYDPATGGSHNSDSAHGDPFSGRRDVLKLTCVGAGEGIPDGGEVFIGKCSLNGPPHVGESVDELGLPPFPGFPSEVVVN